MSQTRSFTLAVALAGLFSGAVLAQQGDPPSGENRFLLTGYGFAAYSDPETGKGEFAAGFTPILLYRIGERFLFESELEFEFEGDEVETEVEYAQIDWLANEHMTVVAGKFLTPFGTFIERLHPAWINKLPTAPLPYQHGAALVPFGQFGLQVRGGVPLGDGYKRLTYAVFVSNGFEVAAHADEEEEATTDDHDDEGAETEEGDHDDESLFTASSGSSGGGDADEASEPLFFEASSGNANGDKALGGRLSLIPAKGLEIGASYIEGSYDPTGSLEAEALGLDFAFHHELFEVRGEWLDTEADRGVAEDGDPLHDQEVTSWYLQPSLRLSVVPLYFLNRAELVARFATLDFKERETDQLSIGFNYYLEPSNILRVAWERTDTTGLPSRDALEIMLAIGF